MQIRNTVQGLTLAAMMTLPVSSGAPRQQPSTCPTGTSRFHGELTKPLEGAGSYSFDEFRRFVESRNWLPANGVTDVRRRADCGGRCIFRGKNERDDAPEHYVRVSNHPICDATNVGHATLPAQGVLIGRLTYRGAGNPTSSRLQGDASFNVGTGTYPGGPGQRLREHYVVVYPGRHFVDRANYAMWRLVALVPKPGSATSGALVVVDSGLFRVCLPRHPISRTVLASFRSCAEVSELHDLSFRREVQQAVLGREIQDTVVAQAQVFALLVTADSLALGRLRELPDEVKFGPRGQARERDDDDGNAAEGAPRGGPFARATYDRSLLRRLQELRYGELHPDAPMWFVCVDGCCSGEPW